MARPMFDSVTIGHYFDGSPVQVARVDAAGLEIWRRVLGYTEALTVSQGGHHEGGASAGTHGKWRVVDLAGFEAGKKTAAGQKCGWAPFHRTQADGFDEHVHAALLIKGLDDTVQTDDLLALQIKGYRQNPPRDGLGPWPFGPYRGPTPPTPRTELDWDAFVDGRYDAKGHLVSAAQARRRLRTLRHNRDVARAVRRLRAARRKAQNPAVRRRLEQFVRELLGMRVRPQRNIDHRHN